MLSGTIKSPGGPISMSKVVMGAGRCGSEVPRELSLQMMDRYWELGGRTFDCGRIYMSWVHNGASKCEKTVGDWARLRGVEKEISVVTKGGHPEFRNMQYSRLAPECLEYDINTSLAVLNMDSVDIYFLHRDDERIPVGEIMDVLDQFVQDKLAKCIGASNWTTARIREANEYAKKNGKTPFSVSQIMWCMADCKQEDMYDLTCLCMTPGDYNNYLEDKMPIMAYSSQAVGFFSKYLAQGENISNPRTRTFLTPVNIERAKRVGEVCKRLGCSPAALCIAYITNNPLDGYAIISNSTMEQMEESMEAADLTVDEETIRYIMG